MHLYRDYCLYIEHRAQITPSFKEKEQEQIGTGDAVRSSAVNAGEAPPVEVAAEGKVAPEAKVMPAGVARPDAG